jgi:endonuclease/exonuclease/phosphatase family metal-dependent hydrolase
MRITSWNLLHGMGVPPTKGQLPPGLGETAAKLARASMSELFAFQEVDHFLPRTDMCDQTHEIAQAIGAKDWAFAPSVIGTPGESWKRLSKQDPEIIAHSSSNLGSYGVSIVSKIPVIEWRRLNLGNSPIGMPLLIPKEGSDSPGVRPIYIRDEPRLALAAILSNGFIVINTHLSFVPGFNVSQLSKLKRWAIDLEGEFKSTAIIVGDLNLPKNLPVLNSTWESLVQMKTYPSWKPSIQFDYLLAQKSSMLKVKDISAQSLSGGSLGISDHLPISVEINT